jgi:hypothetical protein
MILYLYNYLKFSKFKSMSGNSITDIINDIIAIITANKENKNNKENIDCNVWFNMMIDDDENYDNDDNDDNPNKKPKLKFDMYNMIANKILKGINRKKCKKNKKICKKNQEYKGSKLKYYETVSSSPFTLDKD